MKKRGNTIVVTPIILCICIIAIILVGSMLISMVKPFIMFEKLNRISNKYMFVIEKFGYLTDSEKESLLSELDTEGFDLNNITLYYPISKKNYGELIEFRLCYKTSYNMLNIDSGKIQIVPKPINININKNSYSKI